MAMLKALGVTREYKVTPGSSIYFELHKEEISQKYFIKVFLDADELDVRVSGHDIDSVSTIFSPLQCKIMLILLYRLTRILFLDIKRYPNLQTPKMIPMTYPKQ